MLSKGTSMTILLHIKQAQHCQHRKIKCVICLSLLKWKVYLRISSAGTYKMKKYIFHTCKEMITSGSNKLKLTLDVSLCSGTKHSGCLVPDSTHFLIQTKTLTLSQHIDEPVI